MARGGLVFVFFFGGCSGVGRVLTTGVVMRRRAISGEMARGGLVFVFFSWGLLRCRACVDHRSGHAAPCHLRRDGTRGVGFCFFLGRLLRCRACVDHRSGHAAPWERWHEGGWFLFFSLEVAMSEGDARSGQTQPPQSDGTRGFWFCRGALLPFVLRAVAGACVGRWTGQPRMPPRERLHEGF